MPLVADGPKLYFGGSDIVGRFDRAGPRMCAIRGFSFPCRVDVMEMQRYQVKETNDKYLVAAFEENPKEKTRSEVVQTSATGIRSVNVRYFSDRDLAPFKVASGHEAKDNIPT